MTRRESWPTDLAAFLKERESLPFKWGFHDCCSFAAAAVRVITGRDFLEQYPSYATREEAEAVMADCGGVEGIATACLGAPIAASFAQRGDIVLLQDNGDAGDALGVCFGEKSMFAGIKGLRVVGTTHCAKAWRV